MRSKKYIFKTLTACFLIALLASCKKASLHNCFESAGSQSTLTASVPNFTQISIYDDINVFLSIGSPERVQIKGGENIIKNIGANVSDGVLTLKNNNVCDWARSYKKSIINVYITMPALTYITCNGVGNIQSLDTIAVDSLQVATESAGNVVLAIRTKYIACHLFGAGDMTLTGSSNQFQCNFYSGSGFAYCDKLTTGYTFFSSASTGDCYVSTTGILDAVLYREGNMYYAGTPMLIRAKTYGKGQLIKE